MLFLKFRAGGNSYALAAKQVVEVVPFVNLRPCPGAPEYVAGLLNYRGKPVPVVDLCSLAGDKRCNPRLSSRIIVAEYERAERTPHTLGLLAESVTDTMYRDDADFHETGLALEHAEYLGVVSCEETGMIQCVRLEHMLPAEIEATLFGRP